jgi:hypothetical protein
MRLLNYVLLTDISPGTINHNSAPHTDILSCHHRCCHHKRTRMSDNACFILSRMNKILVIQEFARYRSTAYSVRCLSTGGKILMKTVVEANSELVEQCVKYIAC